MSATQISSLLIIWSTAAFLAEVPSGAWADIVDRRLLLTLSGPVSALGFAVWTLWPTYPGFALGFGLWALSGALTSGTFEALLYDELAAHGRESSFARVLGWTHAAEIVGATVGIAAGGPLYSWGGYPLVGAASVAVALVHGALAWSLPPAPRRGSADETRELAHGEGETTVLQRYVEMLHSGVREATRHGPIRHVVIIAAVLMGVSAYDEYFPLLAREQGATTGDIPVLMALITAGQVAGTALAGRAANLSRRSLAAILGGAALMIASGALAAHPIGVVGIALGYGAVHSVTVVSEARLQSLISGPARATVTSTMGFGAEAFAVACYASVAIGAAWWSIGIIISVLCVPLLGLSAALRTWWPDELHGGIEVDGGVDAAVGGEHLAGERP